MGTLADGGFGLVYSGSVLAWHLHVLDKGKMDMGIAHAIWI